MKKNNDQEIRAYSRFILTVFEKEPNDLIPLTTEQVDLIKAEIAKLDERDQNIVVLHQALKTDQPLSYKMIGKKHGITRERVRQLEKRAIRHLRGMFSLGEMILFYSDIRQKLSELDDLKIQKEELRRRQIFIEKQLPSFVKEELFKFQKKYLSRELAQLPILKKPVSHFEFTVRIHNCFARAEIKTIWDLVNKSEKELLCIRGFGRFCLKIVKDTLAKHSLYLGMFQRPLGAQCQGNDRG